ncbi:response regulator transcription factor [Cytobacillus sp. Hm23]
MFEGEVIDFIHRLVDTKNINKRIELMLRGSLTYFPFERASIFSYSQLSFIGEGVMRVDANGVYPITYIREDVRTIPPIQAAITRNKAHYLILDQLRKFIPNRYIDQFELSSLLVIPLSYLRNVFGCVLIDRYVGTKPIENSLITNVMEYYQLAVHSVKRSESLTDILSRREVQTLQFLSNGYSTKEIAILLKISEFTTRDYISSAIKKLNVNHRTEAVAVALREKIIH